MLQCQLDVSEDYIGRKVWKEERRNGSGVLCLYNQFSAETCILKDLVVGIPYMQLQCRSYIMIWFLTPVGGNMRSFDQYPSDSSRQQYSARSPKSYTASDW